MRDVHYGVDVYYRCNGTNCRGGKEGPVPLLENNKVCEKIIIYVLNPYLFHILDGLIVDVILLS